MNTCRELLDQGSCILMEGALGERLKREFGLAIDGIVAMASLIYEDKGRDALAKLWGQYQSIAQAYHLPLFVTTPTRRANQQRVSMGGYQESIIEENVAFLRQVMKGAKTPYILGGLMGCKGDAYTGEGALNTQEARNFHFWQANLFAKAGVDVLYAGIMPSLPEACGMAQAMSDTGIPYIISFTIQRDGRLIDHTSIHDAINIIDHSVEHKPLCYMTNCVHPAIVFEALSQPYNQKELVRTRFKGIQANTSSLDYCQLDHCEDLKTSDPVSLALSMERLKDVFDFQIFGGCCGTNHQHMEEIAKRIQP